MSLNPKSPLLKKRAMDALLESMTTDSYDSLGAHRRGESTPEAKGTEMGESLNGQGFSGSPVIIPPKDLMPPSSPADAEFFKESEPKVGSKRNLGRMYHGSKNVISGGMLQRYMGPGKQDSGAIFVTPSIAYAQFYKGTSGALYAVEIGDKDIFDPENEQDLERLADGYRALVGTDYDAEEDAMSDYQNVLAGSYGDLLDWAVGGQILEAVEAAGFDGMRLRERPGNIDINPEGGFSVSGEPIESVALFKGPIKAERIDPVKTAATPPAALLQNPNFQSWFRDSKVVDDQGRPKVVYRGDYRADRVGDKFKVNRTTSGRFYFTDDPAIASNYSMDKPDTGTMEEAQNYHDWFKFPGQKWPRERIIPTLQGVWHRLTPDQKARVKHVVETTTKDDDGNIQFDAGKSLYPNKELPRKAQEYGGNWLLVADDIWLDSGTLFGEEREFSKILDRMSLPHDFDDPSEARSVVTPVFLSIQNPVDTSAIPQQTISALRAFAQKDRSRGKTDVVDQWDKKGQTPKQWVANLEEDLKNGTTYAWTTMPENITKALQGMGYDGVKDTGGKHGGDKHIVWIAFEPNQIKSATGNKGTFDSNKPSIIATQLHRRTNTRAFANRCDEIAKAHPDWDTAQIESQAKLVSLGIKPIEDVLKEVQGEDDNPICLCGHGFIEHDQRGVCDICGYEGCPGFDPTEKKEARAAEPIEEDKAEHEFFKQAPEFEITGAKVKPYVRPKLHLDFNVFAGDFGGWILRNGDQHSIEEEEGGQEDRSGHDLAAQRLGFQGGDNDAMNKGAIRVDLSNGMGTMFEFERLDDNTKSLLKDVVFEAHKNWPIEFEFWQPRHIHQKFPTQEAALEFLERPSASWSVVSSEKHTHEEVAYESPSRHKGQTCAGCTMFLPPNGCTDVVSPIKAADWCDEFKAKEGRVAATGKTLYHVTPTDKVPSIKAKGILPLQTSNWVKGPEGERYGEGDIYAIDNPADAIRWASKMDWEFNKGMGTGKISIVVFKSGKEKWKTDAADPMSQAMNVGKWLKAIGSVKPEQIISSHVLEPEMVKAVIQNKEVKLADSPIISYGMGTPIGGTDNPAGGAEDEEALDAGEATMDMTGSLLKKKALIEMNESPSLLPPRDDLKGHLDEQMHDQLTKEVMHGVREPLNPKKKKIRRPQINPLTNPDGVVAAVKPGANMAMKILRKHGISNTADLDRWIKDNPRVEQKGPYKGEKYLISRYSALVELVGENDATWIMHNLATDSLKFSSVDDAGKTAEYTQEDQERDEQGEYFLDQVSEAEDEAKRFFMQEAYIKQLAEENHKTMDEMWDMMGDEYTAEFYGYPYKRVQDFTDEEVPKNLEKRSAEEKSEVRIRFKGKEEVYLEYKPEEIMKALRHVENLSMANPGFPVVFILDEAGVISEDTYINGNYVETVEKFAFRATR